MAITTHEALNIRTSPYSMDQVLPQLFVGGYIAACDKKLLDIAGITHVMKMFTDNYGYPELGYVYHDEINYLVVDAIDIKEFDISQFFPECVAYIKKLIGNGMDYNGKNKVLVHCHAGISRSTSIVIAYLIKQHNMTLPDALNYVKTKRWQCHPNSGFIAQLNIWENMVHQ